MEKASLLAVYRTCYNPIVGHQRCLNLTRRSSCQLLASWPPPSTCPGGAAPARPRLSLFVCLPWPTPLASLSLPLAFSAPTGPRLGSLTPGLLPASLPTPGVSPSARPSPPSCLSFPPPPPPPPPAFLEFAPLALLVFKLIALLVRLPEGDFGAQEASPRMKKALKYLFGFLVVAVIITAIVVPVVLLTNQMPCQDYSCGGGNICPDNVFFAAEFEAVIC
nr:inverted formin-2-like [Anolis sagrei ordinatus]